MADAGIKSVSDLARRAHVSRDTFQAWWRGRPPQRSTAELVARELGVTYADLIAAREGDLGTSGHDTTISPDVLALVQAITALVERLDQLLPSEKVREMLAWAAEHMTAETPSPDPTPDHNGSPARS